MEKYLRHYAEPEIEALDDLPHQQPWTNVLVIPVCNESSEFLRPPPPCAGRSLMILVVNESVVSYAEVSLANQSLAEYLQQRFVPVWQSAPNFSGFKLSLLRDQTYPRDVLLVDRFSPGCQLPPKRGVGHARKIGADLAASLIHSARILSPWIHCSDGDTYLPDTYFSANDDVRGGAAGCSALVYPYHHCDDLGGQSDTEVIMATQLYELSLRYYVAAMKFAGSPYAFHTIGSTMVLNASHYAKVRGFPKREAGEDFYLLNKLAKVGNVIELEAGPQCEPIRIAARRSDRVPFGTGAAVNKITALGNQVEDFRFYHPTVFVLLRLYLQAMSAIWNSHSDELTISVFGDAADEHDQNNQKRLLLECLKEMGMPKALQHAFRQSKDLGQFTRQMHTWFDAFRTLKLIHALRDKELSSIAYVELQANQTFRLLLSRDSSLMEFNQRSGF
jgi:hypothetical protein